MLSRIFINAVIDKVNDNAYQLILTYSWYYLYTYQESYVFSTLEDAKEKLMTERCSGRLVMPKNSLLEKEIQKNLKGDDSIR